MHNTRLSPRLVLPFWVLHFNFLFILIFASLMARRGNGLYSTRIILLYTTQSLDMPFPPTSSLLPGFFPTYYEMILMTTF